jgi:hypothetical protein
VEEKGIGHAFEELIAIHQMLLGFRDNYLEGCVAFASTIESVTPKHGKVQKH